MYLITNMNNSVFLTGWEEPGFNNQHLATAGKYNLCKVTEKLSCEALRPHLHTSCILITEPSVLYKSSQLTLRPFSPECYIVPLLLAFDLVFSLCKHVPQRDLLYCEHVMKWIV